MMLYTSFLVLYLCVTMYVAQDLGAFQLSLTVFLNFSTS